MEGLNEALQREDIGTEAGQAARELRRTAEAVTEEARTVARSPEMQQAGAAVSSGVATVRERTGELTGRVGDRAATTRDNVTRTLQDAQTNVVHAIEETRNAVRDVMMDVKMKAQAVSETATRAAQAPGRIMDDYKRGVSGWFSRTMNGVGMYAAAGLIGGIVLVLFTIFLVVALNGLLGDPWGTLVTAILYAVVAGVIVGVAKSRMREADERMQQARREVRDEIDYVKEPVRGAFGARRT